MAFLAPAFRSGIFIILLAVALYALALIALTSTWLQRHALYAHLVQTTWWFDINKPEQFGFARNQITPFTFSTPDKEVLYAWHVMPLGLYAKHEVELLLEPSGLAEDITKTAAFKLLTEDPEARLVISFHGNAGSVTQGWRTDSYRALSSGSTSTIHILTPDYRGFGYSTGTPSEDGLIIDGIATVNWALRIAKIPPHRIVIVGHSLGTAVTSAVVEYFAKAGIEFSGTILIAGFTDIPTLLENYAIGGLVPVLAPLKRWPGVRRWFLRHVTDRWTSATRLANYVRISKRVRLFMIHSQDDHEIPCEHSHRLFAAAANATTPAGMEMELLDRMKSRGTIDMGDGAFLSTWKASEDKIIREQIVAHGGHNRVVTYSPVALAVLKAFEVDDSGILP